MWAYTESQQKKLFLSTVLVLTAILLVALKLQTGLVVLAAWGLLAFLAIISRSRGAMIGITVFSLFLYIGPQMGWLYGRDTHSVALVAKQITTNGWPIPDSILLTWSTPYTPGIHLHIAIVSVVTDLGILPSIQPELLAPAIIPLFYTVTILLFGYLFARRLISSFEPHYVLAIVFWTSLFYRKTVPRRHTLGFVFFVAVVYLGYQYATNSLYRGGRFVVLFTASVSALTITHHLLSLLSMIVLLGVGLANSRTLIWKTIPIQAVIISLWFLFSGFVPLEFLFTLIRSSTPETVTYANRIHPTVLSMVRFGAWFIYAAFLAIPVLWVAAKQLTVERRLADRRVLTALAVGAIAAPLSVGGWQLGLVAPDRLLAIYIVICGPFAVWAAGEIHSAVPRILLAVLFLTGVILVPFHVISDAPPRYQHLQDSQRHAQTGYAAAEWLENGDGIVIADANMYELITPLAQRPVIAAPETINSGVVPPDRTVVLQESDAERYFGPTPSGMISINPPRLWERYNATANRIYDNGDVRVFI